MRARPLVLLLGVLGLLGCARPPPAPVAGASAAAADCPGVAGARARLAEIDRLAAARSRSGGGAALLSFAAADLVLLVPGENEIVGVNAARAYFARARASAAGWNPIRMVVSADGRLGVSFGWLDAAQPGEGGTQVTRHGKVINVWRDVGGRWRLTVHMRTGARAVEPEPPPAGYALQTGGTAPRCGARVDAAVARRALRDVDAAFAARSRAAGRALAFHDYAADDAAVLGPAQVVYGRQAILAYFAARVGPGETLDWRPTRAEAAQSGDLGYTIGEATFTAPGAAGREAYYSKYVTVWEKRAGGPWRFITDTGNPRPAPAPGR